MLIVLFGFLFVTVSSRLTGEIGSSSQSDLRHDRGHAVADLPDLPGAWAGPTPQHRLIALSVAAVVCIASSNGGTTSQDLKTGFLVGATPKWQQWAILVGSISSALVIGVILMALNQAEHGLLDARTCRSRSSRSTWPARADRTAKAPDDDANSYYVWHATEGNAEGVPPGKYLVDDAGRDPLAGRSGHQRPAHSSRRRHGGAEVSAAPRPS